MQKIISDYMKSMTGYIRPQNCDSSKIFTCEVVVLTISSFLDDQDILYLFQVSKGLREMSKKNNVLQVRLLKIKLERTELILNQISKGTYKRNQQPNYLNANFLNLINQFDYNQLRFASSPFKMDQIPLKTFRKVKNNSQDKNQSQIVQKTQSIKNGVQDNKPVEMTQSWPVPKPKQTKELEQNQIQQNQGYNVQELKDIVYEVKMIMLFNPKSKQDFPAFDQKQRQEKFAEFKTPGQDVINSISRNLCPIVTYKRIKEAVNNVYGKPWDKNVIQKSI